MTRVSIVIPFYNEGERLAESAARLIAAVGELPEYETELLFSDDGSTDRSAALLEPYGEIRVIGGEHLGKGGALARGILAATGDYIFYTDADLAYGTEVIPRMLAPLTAGEADAVIGSRLLSRDGYGAYPASRRFFSRAYQRVVRLVGGIRAHDPQCGCKAYTAEAAKTVFTALSATDFSFEFETLLRAERTGFRVKEIPVRVLSAGRSSVRPVRDGLRMLRAAIRIRKTVGKR